MDQPLISPLTVSCFSTSQEFILSGDLNLEANVYLFLFTPFPGIR